MEMNFCVGLSFVFETFAGYPPRHKLAYNQPGDNTGCFDW
jgi:hypothetical protein